MAKTKRKDAMAAVLAALQKDNGAERVRSLDGLEAGEATPFGIDALDHGLIRIGGLPIGRITEMFSEEGVGKSSLAYAAIGAAQKNGLVTALADTEYSLSAERARTFGVDPARVIQLEPTDMEHCLQLIEQTVDAIRATGAPGLIVWDSVAATPTRDEVEAGAAPERGFDVRAKVLSRSMRVLAAKLALARVALLCINQTRQKIGVMFGDPTTTPGGMALKFHASLRLQLYGGKAVEVDGKKIGRFVTVSIRKSRYAPPDKVRLRLDYDAGWNNDWSTLEYAKEHGVVGARDRGAKALEKAYEVLGWPRTASGGEIDPDTDTAMEAAGEED